MPSLYHRREGDCSGYQEKLCHTELKSTVEINKDKTWELPDGNIIFYVAERFRCAKVFFHPCSYGKEDSGFHDTSFQSNMRCYLNICKELHINVLLSGGTPNANVHDAFHMKARSPEMVMDVSDEKVSDEDGSLSHSVAIKAYARP